MRAALTNDDEQKNDTQEEEVEKTNEEKRTKRKETKGGKEQRQSGVSHRTDSRILKSPDREMEREMKRNQ